MNKITAILLGGAIAGAVDIGAAMLINHVSLDLVLRVIASGLKGKAATTEAGTNILWLGFGLQELMGIIIAAIFGAASMVMPVIARRWVTFGLLYGVAVFVVMNYLVLPLSAASTKGFHFTFHPVHMLKDLVAMCVFGLIIAFFAHLATRKARSAPSGAAAVAA
jgi:hypothetical protein